MISDLEVLGEDSMMYRQSRGCQSCESELAVSLFFSIFKSLGAALAFSVFKMNKNAWQS